MMTLEEIKQAVDQLSEGERRELVQYLEQRPKGLDPEALLRAVTAFREGLSQTEIDQIVAAMNEDYIEEVDLSMWEDN